VQGTATITDDVPSTKRAIVSSDGLAKTATSLISIVLMVAKMEVIVITLLVLALVPILILVLNAHGYTAER